MSIRLSLASAVLSVLALGGCASTATTPKSTAAAANCTDSGVNPACAKPGERSYSQSDIQRTGKTSAADALALLDPAVVVKH